MNNFIRYKIFGFIFIILIFGCTDPIDVPEPDNEDPVFSANLSVDGDDETFDVGRQGYHSEALQISDRNSKKIRFVTTIKPEDCPRDCPRSIRFRIGSQVPFDQDFTMEKAILPGQQMFLTERISDSVYVELKNDSEGNINGDRWTVNGRTMKNIIQRETGRVLIPKGRSSVICVEQEDSENNVSKICKTFKPGDKEVASTFFNVTQSTDRILIKVMKSANNDARLVDGYWEMDKSTELERPFSLNSIRGQELCFISDHKTDGTSSKTCLTIQRNAKTFRTKTLFSIIDYSTHVPMAVNMNGVEIRYINKLGNIFRTSSMDITNPGKFEILSINPFTDPNNRRELLRLHVKFSATLINPVGRRIRIENGEAFIPVPVVKP